MDISTDGLTPWSALYPYLHPRHLHLMTDNVVVVVEVDDMLGFSTARLRLPKIMLDIWLFV